MKKITEKLKEPFFITGLNGEEIPSHKWAYKGGKRGGKGILFPYLDARQIFYRLTETVGIENWQSQTEILENRGDIARATATISIKFGEEWIDRSDVGLFTALNDTTRKIMEKGALSDAIKRTAVQWGIGAYLYELDEVLIDLSGSTPITSKGVKLSTPDAITAYVNGMSLEAMSLIKVNNKLKQLGVAEEYNKNLTALWEVLTK